MIMDKVASRIRLPTIGIDSDRPQSVMEALIISLHFGLPTAIVVAPAKQLFVPLA